MYRWTCRKWISRVLGVALALVSLVVPRSEAQQSGGGRAASGQPSAQRAGEAATRRVSLGVHLLGAQGVTITGPNIVGKIATAFGPGAGVTLGYALNRTVSVFATLDVARQNSGMQEVEGSFGLVHGEIGVRANLPLGSSLNTPYVMASFGKRTVGANITDLEFDEEYPISFSGTMIGLGGGVQRMISRSMSFDAGLMIGMGAFGDVDEDGEKYTIDVDRSTSLRFRFGVVWRL